MVKKLYVLLISKVLFTHLHFSVVHFIRDNPILIIDLNDLRWHKLLFPAFNETRYHFLTNLVQIFDLITKQLISKQEILANI